jgi:hypothetical protein
MLQAKSGLAAVGLANVVLDYEQSSGSAANFVSFAAKVGGLLD